MTQPVLPEIGEVDGQKVIATAWAKLPIVTRPNTTPTWVTTDKVVECLLEDERTVYIDLYFAAGTCDRWFNTSKSVATHMRVHGTVAQLKKAAQELQELKAHAARVKKNRQEGAKKAAFTRTNRVNEDESSVIDVKRQLAEVERAIEGVRVTLGAVGEEFRRILENVNKLPSHTSVDPEVAKKAAAYDTLKGLMKD